MKKLILLAICLALTAGCSGSPSGSSEARLLEWPASLEAPPDYGEHSAMNSLDYPGVYLPVTAPAEHGVARMEIFDDGRFSLVLADGKVASGPFAWDHTGSTIRLTGPDAREYRFFVGENFIKRVGPGLEEGRIYNKNMD